MSQSRHSALVGWRSLVSGNTCYLVFSGGRNRGIAGDTTNGDANGQVFANDFDPFPEFDFAFRPYAAVVPEPAAWLVLGLGLLAVAPLARSRRGRAA